METKERGKKPGPGRRENPQVRKNVNRSGPAKKQARPANRRTQTTKFENLHCVSYPKAFPHTSS